MDIPAPTTALTDADVRAARLAALRREVASGPFAPDALNELCNLLIEGDNLEEARGLLENALASRPGNGSVRYKLGYIELLAVRLERARELFEEVIADQPGLAPAFLNLGTIAHWQQDLDRAEFLFRHALALRPGYDKAEENLGMVLLTRGQYAEGWPRWDPHAHRSVPESADPRPELPRWDGRADPTVRLLVYPEHGLGDTLQFVRYLREARQRLASVLLYIDGYWRPLRRLFEDLAGVDVIVDDVAPAIDATHGCSLLSLPRLLGAGAPSPDVVPYLSARSGDTQTWRARMGETRELKVGLVWAGNPRPHQKHAQRLDLRRSMRPELLAPLLEIPGIRYFSVQVGAHDAGWTVHDERIVDLGGQLRDMADTAALLQQLDMLVSVDTAVVHLAGAIGTPVWMLNRFDSCWRWGMQGATSAWYPSLRIFRQHAFGAWAPVVRDVGAALAALRDERWRDVMPP